MGRDDQLDVAPGDGQFHTTQWTMLLGGLDDESSRKAKQAIVLEQYWKPVYCYLRRKGFSWPDAQDLTQGFFCEIVLSRPFLERADRKKGRFRSFLLTAVNHFVIDEARRAAAARRNPGGVLVSLSGLNVSDLPDPAAHASPEQAFHHRWAVELLRQVLAELEGECRGEGLATHWAVFQARRLRPILDGVPAASLEDLCREHQIGGVKQASNMLQTVRRRFAGAMRRRVRRWVADDADADEEIRDLLAALSGAA